MEVGIYIDSLGQSRSFASYESNVLYALRFMIDCDIAGGGWVELPPGSYVYQPPGHHAKQSHCQLEAHVHYSKLKSYKPEGVNLVHSGGLPALKSGHEGQSLELCQQLLIAESYGHTSLCASSCLTPAARLTCMCYSDDMQVYGARWRP